MKNCVAFFFFSLVCQMFPSLQLRQTIKWTGNKKWAFLRMFWPNFLIYLKLVSCKFFAPRRQFCCHSSKNITFAVSCRNNFKNSFGRKIRLCKRVPKMGETLFFLCPLQQLLFFWHLNMEWVAQKFNSLQENAKCFSFRCFLKIANSVSGFRLMKSNCCDSI